MVVIETDSKEARRIEFLKIIGEAENLHQIHLSEFERLDLADWMISNEWSYKKAKFAVYKLQYVEKYGKLAPEAWIKAVGEPLYTREEALKLADEKIELRKRRYEAMNFDEDQIAKEGLMDISVLYQRKRMLYMEKIMGDLKKRVKKAELFIKSAPEELKKEILDIASGKGLIDKSDPHWRQILHYTAPNILDEIEQIMKRV